MESDQAATAAERIVVIDDDYAMRRSCQEILTRAGYDVTAYEDGVAGLEAMHDRAAALAVVDLKMPGLSGLDVIARIHDADPSVVILVITGYATIETAVDAMKAGAFDFLPKPFTPEQLRIIVGRALEHRRLDIASRELVVERELLKRRFVTFVSHQLKTPLVAIHQYLDVLLHLEGDDVVAKREQWLTRCLRRTEELQAIIDDWLTLARMDDPALARRREPVDVRTVLARTVENAESVAEREHVMLALEAGDTACTVRGDPTCLGVLFDNLVANAIKYNRADGSVRVHSTRTPDEVIVEVRDTGIGIPAECQAFVFDEFFRVRDDRAKKVPGTGLGLAIGRRIVAEHGGAIELESQPAVGTVVRVRLPRARATDRVPEQEGG